ncbi:hypothetical protein RLOC_00007642 [Lonchura striata]|uniref:Uncharacterized protein n=1 Tax=Lonchura striata TaxID=40157 RepID=A0A218UGD6_9PASE|nr:hypothetical protein RLOC_00007642 [Lonchura striata domestica]
MSVCRAPLGLSGQHNYEEGTTSVWGPSFDIRILCSQGPVQGQRPLGTSFGHFPWERKLTSPGC